MDDITLQKIEITKSNLKDFLGLDIVAFSLAYVGAQGEPGGINIVTLEPLLYHTNHLKYELSPEEVYGLCPIIKECDFKPFSMAAPDGWQSLYLGGGNFLVLKEELFKSIEKQENLSYNKWKQTVIDTILLLKNKGV